MTTTVRGQHWTIAKHFHGPPNENDVELHDYDVPAIQDGEMLLEAVFLTVDPYMRSMNNRQKVGDVMMGEQVARVIKSKNPKFPVGCHVVANVGWATHSVSDGKTLTTLDIPKDLPLSLALGVLGMTGRTGYLGLIEVCNPKAKETVLVSGAAGAVGTVVGQVAKILGCRVIGLAGSDAKVKYLKELGFDVALNYKKTTDLAKSIKSVAPDGIDVYFDNVGGQFLATIVNDNMNTFGRVTCCGSISTYNATTDVKVSSFSSAMVNKRIKMQGFVNYDHAEKYPAATKLLTEWTQQGKLQYKEHVTEGFGNMYKAFMELFTGATTGKAIVKV